MAAVLDYDWPGNVRELQNVVRRAIAMARGPMARVDDLPDDVLGPQKSFRVCQLKRKTL